MRKSSFNGFTLIELILVILIMSIVVAISSKILAQGFDSFMANRDVIEANWQGMIAMERLSRDIREVRSANDITTFTANEFNFIDINGTSIDYQLSGTDLTLNGNLLASGISALNFTYYDKNGNPSSTQANIHYVKVNITVTGNNANYTLGSSIYLRNLSS